MPYLPNLKRRGSYREGPKLRISYAGAHEGEKAPVAICWRSGGRPSPSTPGGRASGSVQRAFADCTRGSSHFTNAPQFIAVTVNHLGSGPTVVSNPHPTPTGRKRRRSLLAMPPLRCIPPRLRHHTGKFGPPLVLRRRRHTSPAGPGGGPGPRWRLVLQRAGVESGHHARMARSDNPGDLLKLRAYGRLA